MLSPSSCQSCPAPHQDPPALPRHKTYCRQDHPGSYPLHWELIHLHLILGGRCHHTGQAGAQSRQFLQREETKKASCPGSTLGMGKGAASWRKVISQSKRSKDYTDIRSPPCTVPPCSPQLQRVPCHAGGRPVAPEAKHSSSLGQYEGASLGPAPSTTQGCGSAPRSPHAKRPTPAGACGQDTKTMQGPPTDHTDSDGSVPHLQVAL